MFLYAPWVQELPHDCVEVGRQISGVEKMLVHYFIWPKQKQVSLKHI